MRRFFSLVTGPLGVGEGALLLLVSAAGSYGLGFLRDVIFAATFGATAVADLYFAAFRLPDFLFQFLALGFISGALLPIFSQSSEENRERGGMILGNFLTVLSLLIFLSSLGLFLLAPLLVPFVYYGPYTSEVLEMTRLLLLSPLLFTLSHTLGTALLAKKRFFSLAVSPLLYNLGIILGMLFFADVWGIYAAVFGALIGAVMHLLSRLVDLPGSGIAVVPLFRILPETKRIFFLGVPRMIGLLALQGVFFLFAALATSRGDGSLAAWELARNIQSLPVSLFGISLATAVFPFFSEALRKKSSILLQERYEKSFFQIAFFTLPSSVGLMMLSPILVSVLFERGAFDAEATAQVSTILFLLALSIPLESLVHLFSRLFFSDEDTMTPAFGKVLFFFITVFLAFALHDVLGLSALGISFVGGSLAEWCFLLCVLQRRYPFLSFWHVMRKILQLFFLVGLMALAVFLMLLFTREMVSVLRLFLVVLGGAFVYLAFAFFMRFPEVSDLWIFRKHRV